MSNRKEKLIYYIAMAIVDRCYWDVDLLSKSNTVESISYVFLVEDGELIPENLILSALEMLRKSGIFKKHGEFKKKHKYSSTRDIIKKIHDDFCKNEHSVYYQVQMISPTASETIGSVREEWEEDFGNEVVQVDEDVELDIFDLESSYGSGVKNMRAQAPRNVADSEEDWTKSGAIAAWIAVGLTVFGWLIFGGR